MRRYSVVAFSLVRNLKGNSSHFKVTSYNPELKKKIHFVQKEKFINSISYDPLIKGGSNE